MSVNGTVFLLLTTNFKWC